MLPVKFFDGEIHLLVPRDMFAEPHTKPVRQVLNGKNSRPDIPRVIEDGDPLFDQLFARQQLPQPFRKQRLFAAQQLQSIGDALVRQVLLYLCHGKIKPPQIADDVQFVHLLQAV